MNSNLKNSFLYNQIIDEKNIFLAIYKLDSYMYNPDLLSNNDLKDYIQLRDSFNHKLISKVIKKVKNKIENILLDDDLFKINVYFKPKKYEFKKDENEFKKENLKFRPLHTADLISQIAMVSMLNILLYKYENKRVSLSELANALPYNFYGNIPSNKAKEIFIPWHNQYKKYSIDTANYSKKCREDGEYTSEITLDLINFFPNIDPISVFNDIIKSYSYVYENDDLKIFKLVVYKLLYCEVININQFKELYYSAREGITLNNIYYTQGIAQGLPQSYFFANIFMKRIDKIYMNVFKGKAFYYVDDSVLFTNNVDNINDFHSKLTDLNTLLNNCLDKELSSTKQFTKHEIHLKKELYYKIQVHLESKSYITFLKGEKKRQYYLADFLRQASIGGSDLWTISSEEEEQTLLNNFNCLYNTISNEITLHKEKTDLNQEIIPEQQYYLKMLTRLKKYYKNRILYLRSKNESNSISEIKKHLEAFHIVDDSNNKIDLDALNRFFEDYDNDILMVNLNQYFKYNEPINDIKKWISQFSKNIFGNDFNTVCYLFKVVSSLEYHYSKLTSPNKYESLAIVMENEFKNISINQLNLTSRINIAKNYIKNKHPNELKCIRSYHEYVTYNSDDLTRSVINAAVSKILDVPINDSVTIYRIHGTTITHDEYRLLVYIRNANSKIDKIINLAQEIFNNWKNINLDTSLIEANYYFKKYIKDPDKIDKLIYTHKFVAEYWKNGSKYLHFFTLHNHEHSIELIKASVKIVKSINFLQIKRIDYYIIFMACYLHDIAMIEYPDIRKILLADNMESNLLYARFRSKLFTYKDELYLTDKNIIKEHIFELFNEVDTLLEKLIRTNHAVNSSNYIKNNPNFNFIDAVYREYIAKVSLAHGQEAIDVYKEKSNGKNSLVNLKFSKIVLRLADLLDMSENRITDTILTNNSEHMPMVSRFHWLSHRAIQKYEITTEYNNPLLEKKDVYSYLSKGKIEEIITIKITLNYHNKAKLIKCNQCKMNQTNETKLSPSNLSSLTIIPNSDKCEISSDGCPLICKWMAVKNNWLYYELKNLECYLQLREMNFFNTKFRIIYTFSDQATYLPSQDYTFIENYLTN